jgi:hypothetical protein
MTRQEDKKSIKSVSSKRTTPLRRSIRLLFNKIVPVKHVIHYHKPLEAGDLTGLRTLLRAFESHMGFRSLLFFKFELFDTQLKVTSGRYVCLVKAGTCQQQTLETYGTKYTKDRPDWLYYIVFSMTQYLCPGSFEYKISSDDTAYVEFYKYNLEAFFQKK